MSLVSAPPRTPVAEKTKLKQLDVALRISWTYQTEPPGSLALDSTVLGEQRSTRLRLNAPQKQNGHDERRRLGTKKVFPFIISGKEGSLHVLVRSLVPNAQNKVESQGILVQDGQERLPLVDARGLNDDVFLHGGHHHSHLLVLSRPRARARTQERRAKRRTREKSEHLRREPPDIPGSIEEIKSTRYSWCPSIYLSSIAFEPARVSTTEVSIVLRFKNGLLPPTFARSAAGDSSPEFAQSLDLCPGSAT